MALAPDIVFTKTAKGLLEGRNKGQKLPRELGQVLHSVDGRTPVADLLPESGMTLPQLQHALSTLATDGYIKAVTPTVQQSTGDELDFTSPQAMATLNAEAASRALAAADATKRAQAEARAEMEANLRVESESRARALAESRAQAEADARAAAEQAAREARQSRELAEGEAREAVDATQRADAEARARTAAATAVRAEAEARARAEAEQRALADVAVKQAAEDRAREEAEKRKHAHEQAQVRAAAEARAGELLEAQVKAMQVVRGFANPEDPEAEAARALVRELEREAEEARTRAKEIAEAEGRANEVPEPEMDIADRVRQLNARVQAERRAREAASRGGAALEIEPPQAAAAPVASEPSWAALNTVQHTEQPAVSHDLGISIPELGSAPMQEEPAAPVSPRAPDSALPEVDLDRAEQMNPRHAEHAPSALEAAMLAHAAQAKARSEAAAPAPPAPEPQAPAAPEREADAAAASAPAAPAEKITPKLEDEDEPIAERLNVDRTAHDLIAEAAEARRRQELEQTSARAAAARRRRQEEEERRVEFAARQRRRKKIIWGSAIAFVVVPAALVAWLQFTPLEGYREEAQRALEVRFNQPARVETVRYVMLPSPRLVLEKVALGQASGVRVKRVDAHVSPLAALSGPKTIELVEASGIEIDPPMLGTLPAWTGGRPAGSVHVARLNLNDAKIALQGASLEPFSGTIDFAPNGTITKASFSTGKAQLALTPSAEGVRVTLDATSWRMPYGPPVTFDRLKLSGLVDQRQIAAAEFSGTLAAGTLEGALNVRWSGPIALEGEFKLDNARVQDMLAELTPSFSARGTLKGAGRFSMQAADWAALPRNPQLAGTFNVSRGELLNIDLVRAIRSPAVGALRGGRTQFESLGGAVQVTGSGYAYRQLQLTSGALNATGALDVSKSSQLSGRLSAELAARGSVVARSQLGIGGTVQDPQLSR